MEQNEIKKERERTKSELRLIFEKNICKNIFKARSSLHRNHIPLSPNDGECSTFLTAVQALQSESPKTKKIRECYNEISTCLEDFDSRLSGYMIKQQDFCLDKCKEFIEDQNGEFERLQAEVLNSSRLGNPNFYDKEKGDLQKKIDFLENKLQEETEKMKALNKKYLKVQVEAKNNEEDNAFFRNNIKEHMGENTSLKLFLRELCAEISQLLAIKFENLESKVIAFESALNGIFLRASKFAKERVTLGALLEEYLPKQVETKRSCSTMARRPLHITPTQSAARVDSSFCQKPKPVGNSLLRELNKEEILTKQINRLLQI